MALQRLGLPADRCVVIEDSERGLASALAAGLRCIVVPNQLTQNCVFRGATAILPNLASVPDFLAACEKHGLDRTISSHAIRAGISNYGAWLPECGPRQTAQQAKPPAWQPEPDPGT